MSTPPPWAYRGSFIPFHLPVPVPGVDPLSSQDVGICWADAWTPAILGALKALTRPETWTGSDADVAAAMQGAQDLLGGLTDGCGASGGFPFLCVADFSTVANPFATWTIDSGCGEWDASFGYLGALCGPFSGHYFFASQIILTMDSPITLTGLDLSYTLAQGLYTTGGDFRQVYIADLTHSTVLASIRQDHLVDGDALHLNWAGSIAGVDSIEFVVQSSERETSGGDNGACSIGNVSISGNGTSPCSLA